MSERKEIPILIREACRSGESRQEEFSQNVQELVEETLKLLTEKGKEEKTDKGNYWFLEKIITIDTQPISVRFMVDSDFKTQSNEGIFDIGIWRGEKTNNEDYYRGLRIRNRFRSYEDHKYKDFEGYEVSQGVALLFPTFGGGSHTGTHSLSIEDNLELKPWQDLLKAFTESY